MGEPAGLREFIISRQSRLLKMGWLLTGDRHLAEDLVQVALIKVWPHWVSVTEGGDPEAYVRRVIITTHLSWRRRRWWGEQSRAYMPEEMHPENADEIARLELRDALFRLMASLPPRQRTVLVLRFYEDLPVEEVAGIMGCSPGTVKSQTAKALAKLTSAQTLEDFQR